MFHSYNCIQCTEILSHRFYLTQSASYQTIYGWVPPTMTDNFVAFCSPSIWILYPYLRIWYSSNASFTGMPYSLMVNKLSNWYSIIKWLTTQCPNYMIVCHWWNSNSSSVYQQIVLPSSTRIFSTFCMSVLLGCCKIDNRQMIRFSTVTT
jgi:hypothetical protein